MSLIELLAVLAVVAAILYIGYAAFAGGAARGSALPTTGGQWEAAHYAVPGSTRVVVRRRLPDGRTVDEHVIAVIEDQDEEYEVRFLAAMAQARARAALFQSETD
jgi:hypothetical protein